MTQRYPWTEEEIHAVKSLRECDIPMAEIIERLGIPRRAMERMISRDREMFPRKKTGPKRGSRHPGWKGGIQYCKGYRHEFAPWHPNARKNGWIATHRKVMTSLLQRPLEDGEVVDHIDGDIKNNAPENLRLFASNAKHLKETLKGRCPQWTEDGKRRQREASARRSAIARQRRKQDE